MGGPHQAAITIEAVQGDVLQHRSRQDAAYVDETFAVARPEAIAGLEHDLLVLLLCLQLQRRILGHGGQKFAHPEHDEHHQQAGLDHGQHHAQQTHAGGAHGDQLAPCRQSAQPQQTAQQGRHRKGLEAQSWRLVQGHQEGVQGAIAALPHAVQFIDEGQEHQQSQQHHQGHGRCPHHLQGHVAFQAVHARPLRRRSHTRQAGAS